MDFLRSVDDSRRSFARLSRNFTLRRKQPTFSHDLKKAILTNNHDAMRALLQSSGVDVNSKQIAALSKGKDWTYLHFASMVGNTEAIIALSAAGAYVNEPNLHGRSPLHKAARYGHLSAVAKLLMIGANVYQRDKKNMSAHDLAVAYKHEKIAKILKAAERNAKETFSVDLRIACEEGRVERLDQLLREEGYNPNATDPMNVNYSYMHYAACAGQVRSLDRLAKSGGTIHSNNEGDTPLHVAAYYAQADCVKKLIELGTDVNERNKDGRTALFWAVHRACTESVSLLLQKGAFVDIEDHEGNSPCSLARSKQLHHILKTLEKAKLEQAEKLDLPKPQPMARRASRRPTLLIRATSMSNNGNNNNSNGLCNGNGGSNGSNSPSQNSNSPHYSSPSSPGKVMLTSTSTLPLPIPPLSHMHITQSKQHSAIPENSDGSYSHTPTSPLPMEAENAANMYHNPYYSYSGPNPNGNENANGNSTGMITDSFGNSMGMGMGMSLGSLNEQAAGADDNRTEWERTWYTKQCIVQLDVRVQSLNLRLKMAEALLASHGLVPESE